MKNKNILGERPRKANNKKLKSSDVNISTRLVGGYQFMRLKHPNEYNTKEYIGGSPVICEEPEMNFLQAFIILLLTIFSFAILFPLTQRALDILALSNCEIHGDCAEVIIDINE